jgi:beta-phosphoglucomutase-like phosphatase (HAD superfamily)
MAMSRMPEAVLFDIDGVLIDSLVTHLKFCKDRADKVGLKITIPTVEQFRDIAKTGRKISPMREFFLAVGFPENEVDAAVKDYEANFSSGAKSVVFDGVADMLAMLRKSGIKLGIVTSNVRNNVEAILGPATMSLFDPAGSFFHEIGIPKSRQIERATKALQVDVKDCVFVGDLPADESAAREAGTKFVGVTYGWGFSSGEHDFETAENVSAIPMAAQRVMLEFSNDLQFDYAWKWFNYHADQRIKMFNYMFVGLGLFATAVVGLVGKRDLPPIVPAALCFAAGFLAVIFVLLDKRNQYLVLLGEDVLAELEKRTIFGLGKQMKTRRGETAAFGILMQQERAYPKYGFLRHAVQGRHRIWLRWIAILLAGLFFVASFMFYHGKLGNIATTVTEGVDQPSPPVSRARDLALPETSNSPSDASRVRQ